MLDPVAPLARPRVALVAGDADSAGQLRAAVADHMEVVYAAAAAEFDEARLRDSGATAALVNLDGGDWLDAVERCLAGAGVAVVFNDPDTSGKLAGWEQARWLRHLTAKLRGSTDYDPPRPAAARQAPTCAVDAGCRDDRLARPDAAVAGGAPDPALAVGGMALPSILDTEAVPDGADSTIVAAPQEESRDMQPLSAVGGIEAEAAASPSPYAPDVQPARQADEPVPLDLDTAALSAMIDARLAEPELQASDSTEVWCVAGGETASESHAESAAAVALPEAALPVAAPVEEKDVLKGLPSVDDWQLVDPAAPVVPLHPAPQQAQPEPAAVGGLAGLELVPLETTVAPIQRNVEPVERWMRVDTRPREQPGEGRRQAPDLGGDAA